MNDGINEEDLQAIKRRLQTELRALPDPSLETLVAYAEGRLDPRLCLELERILKIRPELAAEVDALRHPDPLEHAAAARALARVQAREALPLPARWLASLHAWLEDLLGRVPGEHPHILSGPHFAAGALMSVLVLVGIGLLRQPPDRLEFGELALLSRVETRGSSQETPPEVLSLQKGQRIYLDHVLPEGFEQLVVAEIVEQRHTILFHYRRPVLPVEPLPLVAGGEPGERILVRLMLARALDEAGIADLLRRVVAEGPPLARISPRERQRRFRDALDRGQKGRVEFSRVYSTEGL